MISARIFAFSALGIFSSVAHGQTAWEPPAPDTLKVQTGFTSPNYNFSIDPPDANLAKSATFNPNVESKTALGVSYRNLIFNYAIPNRPNQELVNDRGSSRSTDFQFRFYGKRTYELSYQSYTGYYLENSADFDPQYGTKNARIKRPDIRTRNIGFNFIWNFHEEDYSLLVALDQHGHQLRNQWSYFAFANYTDAGITAKSPFIPTNAQAAYGQLGLLQSLDRRSLIGGAAIGGIITGWKWYLSGYFALGFGGQQLSGDFSNMTDEKTSGCYTVSGRMSAGYNGENHLFGLTSITDSVSTNYFGGTVSARTIDARFFYAYRFSGVDIPFLNPISDWFD